MMTRNLVVLSCVALLSLSACSSREASVGRYKVGSPYTIKGQTYYPQVNYDYSETGVASWYGPGFDGEYTANGEVYDQTDLTAAHRTLPLPTMARVTNLDNGRSIVVRINDRGPYASNRIIDMSRRSAQMLGFEQAGTANVRVDVMPEESKVVADAARRRLPPSEQLRLAMATARAPIPSAPVAPSVTTDAVYTAPVAAVTEETHLPPVTDGPVLALSNEPSAHALMRQAHAEQAPQAQDGAYATSLNNFDPAQSRMQVAANTIQYDQPVYHETYQKTYQRPYQQATTAAIEPLQPGYGENLYVQAAAFSVEMNAARLRKQLASVGPARVSTKMLNGVPMYRVQLGPYANANEAYDAMNEVMRSGYADARIVKD